MSNKEYILFNLVENPAEEIKAVRSGLYPADVESFLKENDFQLKDTLKYLDINSTTFFNKKKAREKLNSEMSEKFMRLVHVTKLSLKVINNETEALAWLTREIPSLGKQKPIDLLDTEIGHRLVEEALLQIEHGVYG